ncbi:hypothetical protein AUK40_03760 [Candidatus Wirthbacteria bacterium CG2_30_54_11]|uniref:Ribbon-helix-helix protein CopG domain-containing protein n=1 Tax=Candidatus Wirthbacteria bacterium CG2_30_54_11 TaxID=1817892 RepID=A0A1J5IJA5_9BACT|nr:MAG: hypothetical protein AUK40_03760 [Candidatus Wirthbacteria bacterium CG2_30_54_11]
MSKQAVSITLDTNVIEKIDSLALGSDRPRSWLIAQAIDSYLLDLDDAEEALRRSRDANDPMISEDEMRKLLSV